MQLSALPVSGSCSATIRCIPRIPHKVPSPHHAHYCATSSGLYHLTFPMCFLALLFMLRAHLLKHTTITTNPRLRGQHAHAVVTPKKDSILLAISSPPPPRSPYACFSRSLTLSCVSSLPFSSPFSPLPHCHVRPLRRPQAHVCIRAHFLRFSLSRASGPAT